MEEGLLTLNLNSLYIYHPSLLKAKRNENRLGESVAFALLSVFQPIMIGPLKKYRPLAVEKLAFSMVKNASEHKHGVHYVSSEEMNAIP